VAVALKRSFDHLAGPYALFERALFGRQLEQARFCHLRELRRARRVLLVGEGDGRVVERVLRVAPHCQVDVIDKSPAMIRRAKRRIGNDARVRFHTTDLRDFRAAEPYDALTTMFVLDCFEEPEQSRVVEHLAALLAPGGAWLYSDFLPSSEGVRQSLWLAALYLAFTAITDIEARRLVDPKAALGRAGLVCETETPQARGLLTSELWRRR
jgi:ubiquinone/menaquinone biosynthesis C-methylase UbiE